MEEEGQVQRGGSAAALSKRDQEDFELLEAIITRGRKLVGLCGDFKAFIL